MKKTDLGDIKFSNEHEECARDKMLEYFNNCPIPEDEKMTNLGLFLNSKNLSRILFFDFLYQKIVEKHGIIIDSCGVLGLLQLRHLIHILRCRLFSKNNILAS